jgi:hypothetical protein
MSPPEVWGPAVWTLFHTLSEKIHEQSYHTISRQLFYMIIRICRFLPCPECSTDASNFLAKIKFSDIQTKIQLKNFLYLFHNHVNAKKRKRLFNYRNIDIYSRANIMNVINNFISKYQTKGNMKLIAESFQRQLIIKDFKNWFVGNIKAFIPKVAIPPQLPNVDILESNKVIAIEDTNNIIEVILEENVVSIVLEEEATVVLEEETDYYECSKIVDEIIQNVKDTNP